MSSTLKFDLDFSDFYNIFSCRKLKYKIKLIINEKLIKLNDIVKTGLDWQLWIRLHLSHDKVDDSCDQQDHDHELQGSPVS